MLNNALRNELKTLMSACRTERIPALRRSGQEEWIYATDIPVLLAGDEKERLEKKLQESGWEYTEKNGWLFLRKPAAEPPDDWYSGHFGCEASCCRSIQERHMGKPGHESETVQRILIKAGEAGEAAYEDACKELHRAWAESLRKGKGIPAVSLRYFGRGKE